MHSSAIYHREKHVPLFLHRKINLQFHRLELGEQYLLSSWENKYTFKRSENILFHELFNSQVIQSAHNFYTPPPYNTNFYPLPCNTFFTTIQHHVETCTLKRQCCDD